MSTRDYAPPYGTESLRDIVEETMSSVADATFTFLPAETESRLMGVKQRDRDDANETVINDARARRVAIADLPQELQDEIKEDLRRMEAGLSPTGKSLTDFPRRRSEQ